MNFFYCAGSKTVKKEKKKPAKKDLHTNGFEITFDASFVGGGKKSAGELKNSGPQLRKHSYPQEHRRG